MRCIVGFIMSVYSCIYLDNVYNLHRIKEFLPEILVIGQPFLTEVNVISGLMLRKIDDCSRGKSIGFFFWFPQPRIIQTAFKHCRTFRPFIRRFFRENTVDCFYREKSRNLKTAFWWPL